MSIIIIQKRLGGACKTNAAQDRSRRRMADASLAMLASDLSSKEQLLEGIVSLTIVISIRTEVIMENVFQIHVVLYKNWTLMESATTAQRSNTKTSRTRRSASREHATSKRQY